MAVSHPQGLSLRSCMLAFASWELMLVPEAAGCKWLLVEISVLPVTYIKISWIPGCMGGGECLGFVAWRAPVKFLSSICWGGQGSAQLWGSSAGSVWGHCHNTGLISLGLVLQTLNPLHNRWCCQGRGGNVSRVNDFSVVFQ